MPNLKLDIPILQWQIRCTHTDCHWQTRIVALQPFAAEQSPILEPEQLDEVVGFWEDYICPQHFTTARRAVTVSATGVAFEEAQLLYVMGQATTTAIPRCPICDLQMQGGHVLEALPFYYDATLTVLKWLVNELNATLRQVEIALYADDSDADDEAQIILRDITMQQSFYEAMCKNFDINRLTVPFLEISQRSLMDWHTSITENLATLAKRNEQLHQRQQQEVHKSPATCPTCHRDSIYLVEATTI